MLRIKWWDALRPLTCCWYVLWGSTRCGEQRGQNDIGVDGIEDVDLIICCSAEVQTVAGQRSDNKFLPGWFLGWLPVRPQHKPLCRVNLGWARAPILHWSDILELQMRRGIEEMMGVEELRMAKILGYCDVKEKWHVWLNSVFKCIKIADAVDSPNEEGERKERQKCHQKGSGEMQRSLYHVCCKSANLFHIKFSFIPRTCLSLPGERDQQGHRQVPRQSRTYRKFRSSNIISSSPSITA